MALDVLIHAMILAGERARTPEQAKQAMNLLAAKFHQSAVSEACIPNRKGPGHHDDHTGRPCSTGGNVSTPAAKDGHAADAVHKQQIKDAKQRQPKRERHATTTADLVDAPIQRVGAVTAHGLAEAVRASPGVERADVIPGSKPPDVTLVIGGKLHGIESKAFVTTKKKPPTVKMGRLTRLQKEDWEADHDATMHTVMCDHRGQWDRHGAGTAETITAASNFPCYYRRGGSNGAATDPPALRISSPAELVSVMALSDTQLLEKYGGRGTRPVRLKGSEHEVDIRRRGSKR